MSRILSVATAVLLALTSTAWTATAEDDAMEGLQNSGLPEFSLETPIRPDRSLSVYLSYFGLDIPCSAHYFGAFSSGGYRIAAHVYEAERPAGTVFVCHGYYDHTGLQTHLIKACLDHNLTVCIFDLPGHGLSSGERGSVDDFASYGRALSDLVRLCEGNVSRPYCAVGHSTGCATLLEHRRSARPGEYCFSRTVFLAPLVRPVLWGPAKLGYSIVRPFTRHTPRLFRYTSSDPQFIALLKNDPLRPRRFPLQWYVALEKWLKRIEQGGLFDLEALVIQGTDDTVVDWRYNLPFLRKKLARCTVMEIPGAKHHLANESEPLRTRVLKATTDYLLDGVVPE